jgi:hypothetical protein
MKTPAKKGGTGSPPVSTVTVDTNSVRCPRGAIDLSHLPTFSAVELANLRQHLVGALETAQTHSAQWAASAATKRKVRDLLEMAMEAFHELCDELAHGRNAVIWSNVHAPLAGTLVTLFLATNSYESHFRFTPTTVLIPPTGGRQRGCFGKIALQTNTGRPVRVLKDVAKAIARDSELIDLWITHAYIANDADSASEDTGGSSSSSSSSGYSYTSGSSEVRSSRETEADTVASTRDGDDRSRSRGSAFFDRLAMRIGSALDTVRDEIPVVTSTNPLLTIDRAPLGRGGFGVAHRASYRNHPAVVKWLLLHKVDERDEDGFMREFEFELSSLRRLAHSPNIVNIYGVVFDDPRDGAHELAVGFILEDMVFGTLDTELKKIAANSGRCSRGFVTSTALDVALGLQAMHTLEPPRIHRDLKPDNVGMTRGRSNGRGAKLLDFGLTREVEGSRSLQTAWISAGNLAYMAPEQRARSSVYTTADIHALGLVLWRLVHPHRSVPEYREEAFRTERPTWSPHTAVRAATTADELRALERLYRKCVVYNSNGGASYGRPSIDVVVTTLIDIKNRHRHA